MKIDVVLANYNHGDSIIQAIEALNNQTLKPNKIFVIDDASIDDSWEKIFIASERFQNIEVIKNLTNKGANYCFNKGLEFCKNELVYFAASDDITYPELFEKSCKKLILNPRAAFVSAETLVYDLEQKKSSVRPIIRPKIIGDFMTPKDIVKEFKRNDHWIMTGACVYRTEYVKSVRGLNPKLGAFSDSFMAKQLAFRHGGIFLKSIGVRWNISKYGYSRSMYKNYEEWDNLKQELKSFVNRNSEFPDWYWNKFSNRLDFNHLRLSSLDYETWTRYSHKTFPWLSKIIQSSSIFINKIFRLTFLLLAFIKYRPYSTSRIIYTYLTRLVDKIIRIGS
jgi:glycosyltransferase involved in cell wall biosynthesis